MSFADRIRINLICCIYAFFTLKTNEQLHNLKDAWNWKRGKKKREKKQRKEKEKKKKEKRKKEKKKRKEAVKKLLPL